MGGHGWAHARQVPGKSRQWLSAHPEVRIWAHNSEGPAVWIACDPHSGRSWGLADDLQAGVPVERLEGRVCLESHDQELEAFQFTGALECTHHEGAHAAVGHE